jgi:hypothetical protein
MPLIGGKNAKKKSSSTTSKRHFTVVMENKEHGLYVSSSPSSAARKAVSKLCATDKKKKVEFQIREITQGSKKKTYGPYLGAIEKLAKPIELKGRVIKYKPVAKLLGKKTKTGGALAKKRGSVLVVQSKDGKISKKYITKKQADKHMKPRHKRLDKGMKPMHKGMHKGMKKLHKSMRGGGRYVVEENEHFIIIITRRVVNGPIQLLFKRRTPSPDSKPNQEMTYEKAMMHDFSTDKYRYNYLITIDGGEYPEPEKKLSNILQRNTHSMALIVSNQNKKNGITENSLWENMKSMKNRYSNFWEILTAINKPTNRFQYIFSDISEEQLSDMIDIIHKKIDKSSYDIDLISSTSFSITFDKDDEETKKVIQSLFDPATFTGKWVYQKAD